MQRLPVAIEEAWDFFSNPQNLPLITPPRLGFAMTNTVPEVIHPGVIITYTIRPMPGFKVRWVTEITHVEAPRRFIDEQRFGPYRFWHHQHHFRPVQGGVEVEDLVHYGLPFGPLGGLAHGLMVRRQLQEIFSFRSQALVARFGEYAAATV